MFKSKFNALVLLTILTSCFSTAMSDGTNTIIKQNTNLSKSKKALLFLRQAGATIAESYQISIINFNSEFDTTSVGNTFTVDTNHNKELNLRPDLINLEWISNDTLKIEYNSKLRVFIKNKEVDNIKVIYEIQ